MRESRETRVLIVDAQPAMRDALAANLAAAGLAVVAQSADPTRAVEAAIRCRPDVVLLDLSLVESHGDWLVGRLRDSSGGARIIVLSSLEDDRLIAEALRAGAEGHLRKDAFGEELVAAIRGVPSACGTPLSPLESEVLQLIARGRSDAEIGARLGMPESAIENHVAAILRKMGVRGRTQAAIRALEHGDIHL